ncbi:MAG: head decoration protein [Oscillospiraceae bacterium]|jgi:hypothetical protein|nr:head decoration protein [Oscillospiraceae bacterium]
MDTHLSRKVGEVKYDKLIAGITPPVHVNSGTIRKLATAADYARGTVLAKSSGSAGDGQLVILGTAAAQNETLTPDCILCDDAGIGTANAENAAVYTAGCFNIDALIVKSGYTLSEADKDKLRERGIYLGAVWPD